jgi:sodium/hydrogen antiporter
VSARADTVREARGPVSAAGVVFAVLLLAFAAFSNGLGRVSLTAPITFVGAGAAISLIAADPSVETVLQIRLVAEVTLALILFHDAAQVSPRQLGGEARPVSRLLLLALPLTVLLGYVGARIAFPEAAAMTALLLAASLAPTDAGLGASIMADPAVPVAVGPPVVGPLPDVARHVEQTEAAGGNEPTGEVRSHPDGASRLPASASTTG